MIRKEKAERGQMEFVCLENMVPEDHLLRKIEAAVDFDKIYEIVEDLYCADNGRPSTDPVVLFKMVIIQHLYGIPSLRKTAEEVKMNIAYRWFIGSLLNETTPHFATLSYNFKHRFTEETTEKVFNWILSEINNAGYLSPEAVFIDGTHIKANANMQKKIKKKIPEAAKVYGEELMNEINEDREKHGKKPFDDDNNDSPKEKEVTESTTDPECGVFHKGEHKKCFAYSAMTMCDKFGYIMGFTLNPGNMHDSVAFDGLFHKFIAPNDLIKYLVMDAGFKTPYICKQVFNSERIPVLPYTRPNGKKGFFRPYEYVYDKYYDCVICPENKVLNYSTTNRDGKREYKCKGEQCKNCPSRAKCTNSKDYEKTVSIHLWADYVEMAEDVRHTTGMDELYKQRKETIERVFADAKEKYGMRYTNYRGLSQVTKWVRLKFAAMNLKKYALHKWIELFLRFYFAIFDEIFSSRYFSFSF